MKGPALAAGSVASGGPSCSPSILPSHSLLSVAGRALKGPSGKMWTSGDATSCRAV